LISIDKNNLLEDLANNLTTAEIAKKYNCSKRTVFRIKSKLGLSNNPCKRKTTENYKAEIISKQLTILGEYVNSKTKIPHLCLNCNNIWDVIPNDIVGGHGCPVCAKQVFYKYLYIIKLENGLFKVGVTNNPTGRKSLGMKYEILSWLVCTEKSAHEYEKLLLRYVNKYKINTGELADGNTETYFIPEEKEISCY
jgi:hypothetical protein